MGGKHPAEVYNNRTYSKRIEVKEGNMFLLFPGEWHSYKPDPEVGW
ncbi:hypothetical protein D0T50_13680, partial [Bacteroides sp. 214]|nr:hypothetical protein [Bacteroides sp. 214]